MANVTSYAQLLKELQKARDKALEGTGKKVAEIAREEIQQAVYDIPEGDYERTGDLKDSLIDFPLEVKGDVAEVEIKHDWQNMSRDPSKFQHASPYWSPWDYRSFVAETVHDGTSGSLFGTSGHWRHEKPYMDNTKDRLEKGKEHVKAMKEELNKMGIKTE